MGGDSNLEGEDENTLNGLVGFLEYDLYVN